MSEEIGIIELLLRDHRLINHLSEELDATDDHAEISRLFRRIVDELEAHEAAEQAVIFPAFRAARDVGDDTLARRLGEHDELNQMLDEMRGLEPGCFGFTKRASALRLEITGHFLREEESVFAAIRGSVGVEQLIELGRRAQAVKALVSNRDTTSQRLPTTTERSLSSNSAIEDGSG